MSITTKLENFLINCQATSEEQFLQTLKEFLETNAPQLPVIESLRTQVNMLQNENKSEQEVYDYLLHFISERTSELRVPFVAEKFMRSKPHPTFEQFRHLSPAQLQQCLEYDSSRRTYHDKIVHTVKKNNENTEFVIWLLEKGFKGCQFDTPSICENNNFALLEYYHKNKVCEYINCHALGTVIKDNNVNFFRYILDNDLIEKTFYGYRISLEKMIDNCIEHNRFDMLKELFAKEESGFRDRVRERMFVKPREVNPMAKASNTICLWLWEKDMKWTHIQAKNLNNTFMISFFE